MNKGVIGITLTQDCAKVGLPLVIDGGVDTNQYLNFGSTGVRSCVLGSEKSGGSAANDSTRTGPRPHSENVAAPNSGLPKSRPQGWDDSLRPIAHIFCRWYIVEPRRGSTPARAARGMATTSCCGNSIARRKNSRPHSGVGPPCGTSE